MLQFPVFSYSSGFFQFKVTVQVVHVRKLILFVAFSVVSLCTTMLLMFNNNLNISADSVNAVKYAVPFSPDVLVIAGNSFSSPSVIDSNGDKIGFVKPSVFEDGSWVVHPKGLLPGFYQVFSGFSQSYFQVKYSVVPTAFEGSFNPLFFIVFILLVLFTCLFLVMVYASRKFFKYKLIVYALSGGFVFIVSILSVFSFVNMSSFSSFSLKPSYPSASDGFAFSLEDSVILNPNATLSELENALRMCANSEGERSSSYSNNTACASSVFTKATELYGATGFTYLANSKYASLFEEYCEIFSRNAASQVLSSSKLNLEIEKGLICNFSWLNHIVSNSFSEFVDPLEFVDYGSIFCDSIPKFSNLEKVVIKQQCSRGIGVSLYNMSKDTASATDFCKALPESFDYSNCVEGVFLEARNQFLEKDFHGLAGNTNIIDYVCKVNDPDLFGFCLRISAVVILEEYSLAEFKDYCLSLGSDYKFSCSVALGHLGFLSFPFTNVNALYDLCSDFDTFVCAERFFMSHATIYSNDFSGLISSCNKFSVEFRQDADLCVKVNDFVELIGSTKRPEN